MHKGKKKVKRPRSQTGKLGGKKACLCEDNTYDVKCCDGSVRAQGIGNI